MNLTIHAYDILTGNESLDSLCITDLLNLWVSSNLALVERLDYLEYEDTYTKVVLKDRNGPQRTTYKPFRPLKVGDVVVLVDNSEHTITDIQFDEAIGINAFYRWDTHSWSSEHAAMGDDYNIVRLVDHPECERGLT